MKDGEQAQRKRLDRIPVWKEGEPFPEPAPIPSNHNHDRSGAMPYTKEEFYATFGKARIGDAVPIPAGVDVREIITGADVDEVMSKVQDYAPSSENELTQSVSMRVWIAKMINGMTLDELGFVRAAVDLVLKEKRK
jgi:hypothetical protein